MKTFVGDEGMSEPEGRVTLTPKSLRATRFGYQFQGLVNGTIVSACIIILQILIIAIDIIIWIKIIFI